MSRAARQKRWRQEHPEAWAVHRARMNAKKKADRLELQRLRRENAELRERLAILEAALALRPIGTFGPLRARARA